MASTPLSGKLKKCLDCEELKPVSQFWKRKKSPDGLAPYCKECFGLRNAESYRGRQSVKGEEAREYQPRLKVPKGMKYCPKCCEVKDVSEFGRNAAKKNGLTAYCLPCHNDVMRENRIKNHGSTRSYHLKERYGLTAEEVEKMIAAQGGLCMVCRLAPAEHVDHDHATGAVRAVLCFNCNGGLGQFKDDPETLRRAVEYLAMFDPRVGTEPWLDDFDIAEPEVLV